MSENKTFTPPKSVSACADMLYELREKRSGVQKIADDIEEREKIIKAYIIDSLEKDNSTGVSGKLANVKVVTKEEPSAQNWDEIYAYIKKKGAFHLLNKALNKASVKEIWENGKDVPGVGKFNVVTVSITKVK